MYSRNIMLLSDIVSCYYLFQNTDDCLIQPIQALHAKLKFIGNCGCGIWSDHNKSCMKSNVSHYVNLHDNGWKLSILKPLTIFLLPSHFSTHQIPCMDSMTGMDLALAQWSKMILQGHKSGIKMPAGLKCFLISDFDHSYKIIFFSE